MQRRAYIEHIESWLNDKKVLILYGARQVGKSTILRILKDRHPNMIILSCEDPFVKDAIESQNKSRIKLLFDNAPIVALDEAQKIENIGSLLKWIHDSEDFDSQIIATGSSSFELSNRVTESLTGRNIKFFIYPYSLAELIDNFGGSWIVDNIEDLIIYGQYPEIVNSPIEKKEILLRNLASDYLFQDVLQFERLQNSGDLLKLLKLLAFQVGSEVSYNELSNEMGIAAQTVERYIVLLEKNFVIFRLDSFSRNLRNELKKSKKFYFYDLGIRNALISNFSPLEYRHDKGALWENFCVVERMKTQSIHQKTSNYYFWRTYDQAEIDLIEESGGMIDVFEFKYKLNKRKVKFPQSFMDAYPVRQSKIISLDNFEQLIEI